MKTLALAALASVALTASAAAHPHHGQSYGQVHGGYHGGHAPYGAPAYSAYSGRSVAPATYRAPGYRSYGGYAAAPRYAAPTRYYDDPYAPPYGARPYGPFVSNSAGYGPTTEGFNFGYQGGPTFGRGRRPVINGVRIFGPPN